MKGKLLITSLISAISLSLFSPIISSATINKEVLLKDSFEVLDSTFNKSSEEFSHLKDELKNKRLIAIGDNNLGIKETTIVKQNLTAYLIENLDFKTILLDVAIGNERMLNDYVTTNGDDFPNALSNLGSGDLNTDEFKFFVEWVKEYNNSKKDEEKIRFYGRLDYEVASASRGLLNYLEKVDLATKDKYSMEIGRVDSLFYYETTDPKATYETINELSKIFFSKRDEYISKSSKYEFELNSLYMNNLANRIETIYNKFYKIPNKNINVNSVKAIDNILALTPNNKAIMWSTNMNLVESFIDTKIDKEVVRFGSVLRENYTNDLFIIGTDVTEGTGIVKEFIYSNLINHEYDEGSITRVKKDLEKATNSLNDIILDLDGNSNYISLKDIDEDLKVNVLAQHQGNLSLSPFNINLTKNFDGIIATKKGTPLANTAFVKKEEKKEGGDSFMKVLIGVAVILIVASVINGNIQEKKNRKREVLEKESDDFDDF